MKKIHVNDISNTIAELCIKACVVVSPDVRGCMEKAVKQEKGVARQVIEDMLKNQDIAIERQMPICQDTGMAMVFLEVGQDVQIVGGDINQAVNDGVKKGYQEGYLRKSVVKDPIHRTNTNDNTPAVINYEIVPGDKLKIMVSPKGFGSENMSRLKMLVPADGIEGVKNFVLETIRLADSNPCPPIVVGVGVGGSFELAAKMAKQGLLRKFGERHPDPYWAALEDELLIKINEMGIGPAGLGGLTTAMAVHINTFATHIAGMPVAVNISCHANRHEEAVL